MDPFAKNSLSSKSDRNIHVRLIGGNSILRGVQGIVNLSLKICETDRNWIGFLEIVRELVIKPFKAFQAIFYNQNL